MEKQGKIIKEGERYLFVDTEGNKWTEVNLTDAIRCLRDFKKFFGTASYYMGRLL